MTKKFLRAFGTKPDNGHRDRTVSAVIILAVLCETFWPDRHESSRLAKHDLGYRR